tara:strand:+ start:1612 stop:1788 length:177 start_codon:yes stop_codon:yes gene_type:complete
MNLRLVGLTLGVFLFTCIWTYSRVFSISDYYTIMTCFIVFGGTMWTLGRHLERIDENN